MLIENEIEIASPADDVYRLMLDVQRVVRCLPGAELLARENGTYRVRLSIKLGPMSLSYGGTVAIVEHDDTDRRAVMRAEASEQRNQGNASATMTMSVREEASGRSRLRVSSDVLVTGRVAQMGRGIMQDVAARMLSDMAQCMESVLSETADGNSAPISKQAQPEAPAPSQLRALSLLLDVFRAKVRRLLRL
jgi:carbon monoxide dehydrogenase subunit G